MDKNGDIIRVGIVGAGRVGMEWHLPDIRSAGGEVIAIADSVEGRAARYASELKVEYAFDDYREIVALPEVDVVAVCTTPFVHAEVAIAALEAGKHVYLEKPPTMNEEEMVRVNEAAQESGRLLMSGSNSIYHNEMQALKRMIDSGELGDIYIVECMKLIRRNIPKGWQREKRFAGGGMGMNSCAHRIDLVLYLLDIPQVVSVTARTYDKFASYPIPEWKSYMVRDVEEGIWRDAKTADVEDMLVALIQFDTGCTLFLRDASSVNMPDEWHFNMYGTKAGATLRPLVLYGETPDGMLIDSNPVIPEDPGGVHVQAYQHFFQCIREGRETQSPGKRSIMTMRILDAIYNSATNSGEEIRLGQSKHGGA